MIYFFYSIIILIIFFIFNKYSLLIGKKLSLIDSEKKVPLLGGIFLIIGIFLNQFHLFYIKDLSNTDFFIFYFLICIFIISILDDRFKLSPILRLTLCSLLIVVFFTETNFFIKTLNFKYLGLYFFPKNIFITYFFSIFCVIVLIHAFNFIDGINGLAPLIGLSWFIYILFKLPYLFHAYFIFLIFMIFFLYLNLKNKSFLGDSGNYIISSLISILIISENLSNPNIFFVEEILLMFLVPGLDLIRLFLLRIKKKQNPLKGDLNHFHHLLIKKYNLNSSLIIYCSLVIIPLLLYKANGEFLIFLIFFVTAIYILIIKKLAKKKY